MAKSKAKRKQQSLPIERNSKKVKSSSIITPPPETATESKTLHDLLIADEDIEISVDTLNTLAQNPALIKSKACKELRTAVFDFRQACTTGFNASVDTNLTARISGALADEGYTEARILLAEMRIRDQKPKLGALCRWVRDLDVVSGLAEQIEDAQAKRTKKEEQLLIVLDAILRVTGPVDYSMEEDLSTAGPIVPRKAWNLRDSNVHSRRTYESVLDKSILKSLPDDIRSQFRVIETTPGAQRKPPNLHPAILWASQDNAIPLDATAPRTTHHTHPIVPNLHLLKDVLSSEECVRIIAAGETMDFTPDAPIRAEGEENSILAHNFYWVVDNAFCNGLWNRVKEFVPTKMHGKQVRGLNRRFRVYRYVPGAEYRAHIDGAWPPSGINPTNDTYIYDSSPPEAKQSSLFTFLIYLNDEFDAGETTFFLPSAKEGSMNAYSVKPVQGSVAMFPHGETEGSLLHEGTGVRKDSKPSAKYVIRTDVLYDVDSQ
ncbi:prolyl 4-hydroxylase protein [Rutstroemia sp. NJR-2017a BBW]|nr:prolyl 4-hydroxylase protein [Rutstroemia sp. NJR-2017a BBW]